jgi:hypothetical protein
MKVTLFVQYEKIVATKAIGIEIGNKGWKNTAVKRRFASLAKMLAMSKGGPSKSLYKYYF